MPLKPPNNRTYIQRDGQLQVGIQVHTALACYNISFSLEQTGALPRALEAAREALRIRQAALPPGHKFISDAEERVRKLEQATR